MIYALNVTNPTNPSYLWKAGCPNLDNDSGCTASMSGIGQTWGIPAVGLVAGYGGGASPVVFVSGGHDDCEDENSRTPSCGLSSKGRVVYAFDGVTGGAPIASFTLPTMRSIVADPALVDFNLDGKVDHVYVADMGGSVYRIDVADPLTGNARPVASWTINRVAYTSGGYRKFLFAPALIQTSDALYVALGSGDREHPLITQYPYTPGVANRFYVFVDKFDGSELNLDDSSAAGDMTDVSADTPDSSCDSDAILPTGSKRGWFTSLTDSGGQGEQTVTSAAVVGGYVAFSTNRPTPAAANSCGNNLGEARGYLMNLLTGAGVIGVDGDCGGDRSSEFVGGGLPPSPVIARVRLDDDTVVTVAIGVAQKDGTVSSAIEAQRIRPTIQSIRRPEYWYSRDNTD